MLRSDGPHRIGFLVLVLVMMMSMQTLGQAAEQPGPAVTVELPKPGFPQSAGMQLKTDSFTIETLDRLHALGFRVVRRGFYWNTVEKNKGTYDFSQYDAQMAHAKKLGMTVIGCLFSSNRAYEPNTQGAVTTPEGREGFANFAAACAKHYQDHQVLWEIWNEPNVRTFWRKDGTHNSEPFAQEYSDLVKATVPKMLAANPKAFVMAGSVSNYWEPSYQWTEMCFKNGVLDSGIRAWSVHPYGVRTPEEFAIGHQRTRELLKKYNHPNMPMLNSERGFSVKETHEGWSGGSKDRALEFQAWHLVRQYLIDHIHNLPITIWYEWGGEEFGMVVKDVERPVLAAAREMIKELSGYNFVNLVPTDSKLDYLAIYQNAQGARKLVAWTSPPSAGTPEEAIEHDIVIETNKSTLQIPLSGMPKYLTLESGVEPVQGKALPGAKKSKPAAATVDGADTLDLKLFDNPDNWRFIKNTGEGSFAISKEAAANIGVLEYDFTKSTAKGTPYVIADSPTNVNQGATAIRILAKSGVRQQLTFRLVDATGQNLQYKTRITGSNEWETIVIPLDRKLEAWGGAANGRVQFPIKTIVFSVPLPGEETKKGQVQYMSAVAVLGDSTEGSAAAPVPAAKPKPEAAPAKKESAPKPAAAKDAAAKPAVAKDAAPAAGAAAVPGGPGVPGGSGALGDQKLFDNAANWKFIKNTGEGSFDVAKDGEQSIGVMNYDFSKSTTKNTPYVMAEAALNVPEGAKAVSIKVRTPIKQNLTFRLIDSTGQTLQFKAKSAGTGQWETIRIPLDKKLENWGGAADGKAHFPLKRIAFSVPQPGEDKKQGKVEYAAVTAVADN